MGSVPCRTAFERSSLTTTSAFSVEMGRGAMKSCASRLAVDTLVGTPRYPNAASIRQARDTPAASDLPPSNQRLRRLSYSCHQAAGAPWHAKAMADATWEVRELPILEAIASFENAQPNNDDIAAATGIDRDQVDRGLLALHEAQYVTVPRWEPKNSVTCWTFGFLNVAAARSVSGRRTMPSTVSSNH
jgi:hypothetical protein